LTTTDYQIIRTSCHSLRTAAWRQQIIRWGKDCPSAEHMVAEDLENNGSSHQDNILSTIVKMRAFQDAWNQILRPRA
jgi:hypothetical protein